MSKYIHRLAQTLHIIRNAKIAKVLENQESTLKKLMDMLPSGSGFDNGCSIALDTDQRIVINTSFHHMDEHGGYDGWTYHKVVITPCLMYGFNMRVTGRDRNGIKDYIGEVFEQLLNSEVEL